MLNMLQELQFAIGSLGEHGGAEGLHDLLDRNGGARELILRRATYDRERVNKRVVAIDSCDEPDEAESALKGGRSANDQKAQTEIGGTYPFPLAGGPHSGWSPNVPMR
jgi:hypothetical protein